MAIQMKLFFFNCSNRVEKDNQKIVNFLKDDRDKVDDWYKKKRKELVAKRDDLFVQLAKMKDSLKVSAVFFSGHILQSLFIRVTCVR